MNFTSSKTGLGRGSLAKEGVQARPSNLIAGTRYSGMNSAPYRGRDQLISAQLPQANPNFTKSMSKSKSKDGSKVKREKCVLDLPPLSAKSRYLLTSRSQWIDLGDGWHQMTVPDSGGTAKCGLHSVIHHNPLSGAPFACVYEPRLRECYNACTAAEPFYDLSFQAKLMRSTSVTSNGVSIIPQTDPLGVGVGGASAEDIPHFQVLFCFQSFSSYLSLTCDLHTRSWILAQAVGSGRPAAAAAAAAAAGGPDSPCEVVLSQVLDEDVKANVFFHVLVQLRGSYISIDINNKPVFTSVRCPEGMVDLAGFPGLSARGGTKFALKAWKISSVAPKLISAKGPGFGGILSTASAVTAAPVAITAEEALGESDDDYDADRYATEDGGWDASADQYQLQQEREWDREEDERIVEYEDEDGQAQAQGQGLGLAVRGEGAGAGADGAYNPLGNRRPEFAERGGRSGSGSMWGSSSNVSLDLRPTFDRSNVKGGAGGGAGGGSSATEAAAGAGGGGGKSMSLADMLLARKDIRDTAGSTNYSPASAAYAGYGVPPAPPVPSDRAAPFQPRGGGGPGRAANAQTPFQTHAAPPAAVILQIKAPSHHSGLGTAAGASAASAAAQFNAGTGMGTGVASTSHSYNRGGSAIRGDGGKGGSLSLSYQVGGGGTSARDDDGRDFRDAPAANFSSSSSSSSKYANSLASGTDARLLSASQELCRAHEKAVVDVVMRDVVQRDLGVEFKDIAALSTAKRLLSEAVILPLMVPEFFVGIREPWKGVLLFGPPGTGKTLLAKAVCSLNQSSFFSCPSSSLVSKYRGESEKIIRCLFEAARLLAPSVVFLDEVDALVGSRGADGEHEASRRLKTEIFSQMDGIGSGSSGSTSASASGVGVMVLATTNCPWDLDEALRRRLEKRIFIPMPDRDARFELANICLRNIDTAADVDIDALCGMTEGYSGADIHIVCREAAMMPMRKLLLHVQPQDIQAMRAAGLLTVEPVQMEDFVQAVANTKPSVGANTISRYDEWMSTYGSS